MFEGSFLPKEARLFKALKHTGEGTLRNLKGMNKNVESPHFYDADKIKDLNRQRVMDDGNGLFGDLGIGALGFIPRKGKQLNAYVKDKTVDFKNKMQELDFNTAVKMRQGLGIKDESMLGKFTSIKDTKQVGHAYEADGTRAMLDRTLRRPSLLAPPKHVATAATPILASMYVADKMYPMDEEQTASEYDDYQDKNGLEDELLTERLDKQAALDKVAHLEDKVEKLASHVEELTEEKNLFWKQAEAERVAKERVEMEKVAFEKEMFSKIAEYDEFKLRTNIRERSKNAVKVAEDLLEHGIIKQAGFKKKVDFLMDCDDETFNLHSSLSKRASDDEKGLASSAYIVDYSSKDDESSSLRPKRGLSIKGQTIGEAAKDLQK